VVARRERLATTGRWALCLLALAVVVVGTVLAYRDGGLALAVATVALAASFAALADRRGLA
jgi:hypothetical protein